MMSDMFATFAWLIVAIALAAAEASTVQLVAIWFSAGALIAMVPAIIGASFTVQFCVFVGSSAILLALTRPILKKKLVTRKTETNAKSVIGMVGTVIVDIDNSHSAGRVLVNGMEWSARAEDGTPIAKDEEVLIKNIEGVKLIVERVF